MRGDIARCEAEAIAVSANPYLEGTLRSNYWRFSGRRNADGAVRLAGGRSLADATARVSAAEPSLKRRSEAAALITLALTRGCQANAWLKHTCQQSARWCKVCHPTVCSAFK